MTTARLSKLIAAVDLAVRYAEDEAHVERVLERTLRALVNPGSHIDPALVTTPTPNGNRVDAMGAPISVTDDSEWEQLRAAVRSVAAEIGWNAAARRYGGPPHALKDLVYRTTRRPGPGRQARLQRVLGTRH